ncbi:hypothetical protein [Brevundimonas sp.]|uniref:hypothetical protein n=1 Tax=Brevundimonas sp. TaxID=1871086 RepID=UPI003567F8EA
MAIVDRAVNGNAPSALRNPELNAHERSAQSGHARKGLTVRRLLSGPAHPALIDRKGRSVPTDPTDQIVQKGRAPTGQIARTDLTDPTGRAPTGRTVRIGPTDRIVLVQTVQIGRTALTGLIDRTGPTGPTARTGRIVPIVPTVPAGTTTATAITGSSVVASTASSGARTGIRTAIVTGGVTTGGSGATAA